MTATESRPAPIGGPAAGAELLRVDNLVKHFPITKGLFKRTVGQVRAVDGVSFSVGRGETVGLVGESGSGKSTVARLVLRLLDATRGSVSFDGHDISKVNGRELKPYRQRMQMVFQDPFSSMNPRMRIVDAVSEPLVAHKITTGKVERRRRVGELLEMVGLSASDMDKYPHQFSGGQAQRIGIARALATGPDLIVCDEAVSALDVSIQAQVLNLLKRLQGELGLSYLFIAHDLNVVRYISDRVFVMYLGQLVEYGPADPLMTDPQHPYTEALIGAIATADMDDPTHRQRVVARGEVPSPANPPAGCRFHTRCPYVMDICSTEAPASRLVAPGRVAACHLRAGEPVSLDG